MVNKTQKGLEEGMQTSYKSKETITDQDSSCWKLKMFAGN